MMFSGRGTVRGGARRSGAGGPVGPQLRVVELSPDEFERCAGTLPGRNFVQSGLTVQIARARARRVVLLGAYDGTNPIAAGAFFIRRDRFGVLLADCQKGPLLHYRDSDLARAALRLFADELRRRGVAALTISPNVDRFDADERGHRVPEGNDNLAVHRMLLGLGFQHGGDAVRPSNPSTTFVKDLSGFATAEEALRSFDHHTRKAIGKAQRNGVKIVEAGPDTLDRAYQALLEAKQAKGAHDHQAKDYYATALQLAQPGHVRLTTAEIDVVGFRETSLAQVEELEQQLAHLEAHPSMRNRKQIPVVRDNIAAAERALEETEELADDHHAVAAVLFSIADPQARTVTTLVGGTVPQYGYFNAFSYLYYDTIAWAIQHGYECCDFYGTWGWDDPGSDGYGNYHFKLGFGGHVRILLGDYTLTLKPEQHLLHRAGVLLAGTLRQAKRAPGAVLQSDTGIPGSLTRRRGALSTANRRSPGLSLAPIPTPDTHAEPGEGANFGLGCDAPKGPTRGLAGLGRRGKHRKH